MDIGDFLFFWILVFFLCFVFWDCFVILGFGVWLCLLLDDCVKIFLEFFFLRISVNLGFLGGVLEFDCGFVRVL